MAPHKNGVDENVCRWNECGSSFSDPDSLYDHITTLHIGRKSAGTLSLECQWTGCNSKASKRDHLTSHARVHINLKPHVCDICSKAFKRPQDLKKHEKIHTEEHHVNHKHSKAVTVAVTTEAHGEGSKEVEAAPTAPLPLPLKAHDPIPHNPNAQHALAAAASMQQQMNMMHPYGFPGYPLAFPMFGQAPTGQAVDLNSFLAHQQQLNAQAAAGMHMGSMGYAGLPGYINAPQYSAYPGGIEAHAQAQVQAAAQAHAMQQYFAAQSAMLSYGATPYAYSQPGVATPIHLAPQPSSNVDNRRSPAPPVVTSTSPPIASSLYPSLPSALNGLVVAAAAAPVVKFEDQPSPANSAHSSHGSRYSHSSHHSASLSPRVPALSPPSYSSPENQASPFSEQDSDTGSARYSAAGRGKKRGFEEAAGNFFGDLKNKRFQDDDAVGIQLDALSQFLLSPETLAPSLSPSRSHDGHSSSSASNCSDYSTQAEVNQINELLLSLGQSIETKDLNDFIAAPPPSQHLAPQPPFSTSMYPSLAPWDRSPVRSLSNTNTNRNVPLYGQHHLGDSLRVAKSIAAPSLVNELRAPQYMNVGRLNRAAPMSYRERRSFDDLDEDTSKTRRSYSSSIRSTSFDEIEDDSTTLAPIRSDAGSLTTGGGMYTAPRPSINLPPIASIVTTSSASPVPSSVTLPSIRALLEAVETTARNEASSSSASSPPSSSASSASSTPSSPPSTSTRPSMRSRSYSTESHASTSTIRPGSSSAGSSAGVVDRLTRRVHKLDVHPVSTEEEEIQLAGHQSSDDEENDHPSNSKRIRFESPEPMEQDQNLERGEGDDDEGGQEEAARRQKALFDASVVKARRMFALRALIMHLNASFRANLTAAATKAA